MVEYFPTTSKRTLSPLALRLVHSFSIAGYPEQITQNQPVTITWSRGAQDPTNFIVALTKPGAPVAAIIPPIIDKNDGTQGVLTGTFNFAG